MKSRFTLILIALTLASCGASPAKTVGNYNSAADIIVLPEATYSGVGQISVSAKNECGLDKSVVNYFAKYSEKYNSSVASIGNSNVENLFKVEITKLIAGRAGSGMGGRYVVSEMSVRANYGDMVTEQHCTAGLGANPFANFKACDRLARCSEQLGNKLARWASNIKKAEISEK